MKFFFFPSSSISCELRSTWNTSSTCKNQRLNIFRLVIEMICRKECKISKSVWLCKKTPTKCCRREWWRFNGRYRSCGSSKGESISRPQLDTMLDHLKHMMHFPVKVLGKSLGLKLHPGSLLLKEARPPGKYIQISLAKTHAKPLIHQ